MDETVTLSITLVLCLAMASQNTFLLTLAREGLFPQQPG
jgi:hypothetical protein